MATAPSTFEWIATLLFGVAILHTFATGLFQRIGNRFEEGSIGENVFHLLGEVEVVFGLWAGLLVGVLAVISGPSAAAHYTEELNFTEPLFVFAIMAVSATRPILQLAARAMLGASRVLPFHREIAVFVACLVLGPLLGSFITEPAAMTVTALILYRRYFLSSVSSRFKYVTLATLFVNVSIGGVLTPYAAPPVLMVAKVWNWDLAWMLTQFGWKSVIACLINGVGAGFYLRKELKQVTIQVDPQAFVPGWLVSLHLAFLTLIVMANHHPPIFIGAFLFFLGVVTITREYQDELKLKESLLVAFFLGGLVVLGSPQRWWLEPLIGSLDPLPLFLGATGLTAITDNAALTYLGSRIPGVSPEFQYALVAGAVSGGGLTVIANAPNPAGFAILRGGFGSEGISPLRLFFYALPPTLVALLCFWLL